MYFLNKNVKNPINPAKQINCIKYMNMKILLITFPSPVFPFFVVRNAEGNGLSGQAAAEGAVDFSTIDRGNFAGGRRELSRDRRGDRAAALPHAIAR